MGSGIIIFQFNWRVQPLLAASLKFKCRDPRQDCKSIGPGQDPDNRFRHPAQSYRNNIRDYRGTSDIFELDFVMAEQRRLIWFVKSRPLSTVCARALKIQPKSGRTVVDLGWAWLKTQPDSSQTLTYRAIRTQRSNWIYSNIPYKLILRTSNRKIEL